MKRALRISFGSVFALTLFLPVDKAFSEEMKELPEVIIKGEKILLPTRQAGETVYTGVEVTQKGITLSGEKGKVNVYEVLSLVPGVVFESPDPNNLASEQANVRIRGVRGYLGG